MTSSSKPPNPPSSNSSSHSKPKDKSDKTADPKPLRSRSKDSTRSQDPKPSSSTHESTSRELTKADYSLRVRKIRATIHTVGKVFNDDPRSGNHASVFLLLEDNVSSIRLNMKKSGPTAKKGTLISSFCPYIHSNSSLRDFDLSITKEGLTVYHVMYLLVNVNTRNEYWLSHNGLGCRFWVQTVIRDLDKEKYISSSSAERAIEGLTYNYSKGKEPEFEEVVPGSFTKPNKRSRRVIKNQSSS